MEDKLQALEELSRAKEALNQDKERIENELYLKEQLLQIEAQEKSSLERLIKDMEQKLMNGGKALESKEQEKARAFREYQQKIKQERAQKKKLLEEKQKQEDQMMNVTRQYKDLQEEATENRKVIEVLKSKYQEVK
jgi:hypothetical protein